MAPHFSPAKTIFKVNVFSPFREVDQWIPVALSAADGGIPVAFVVSDGLVCVPFEENRQSLGLKLALFVPYEPVVANEEVERRTCGWTLSRRRFKPVICFSPAAFPANNLVLRWKLEVWNIASKAIAVRLARKQVVEVRFHRLLLCKPGLRYDVLTIEGT